MVCIPIDMLLPLASAVGVIICTVKIIVVACVSVVIRLSTGGLESSKLATDVDPLLVKGRKMLAQDVNGCCVN